MQLQSTETAGSGYLSQSLSVPSCCVPDCRYAVQSESAQWRPSRTPVLCVSSSPPRAGFRTDTRDGTGTRRRTGTHSDGYGSRLCRRCVPARFHCVPVPLSPSPFRPSRITSLFASQFARVKVGPGYSWEWYTVELGHSMIGAQSKQGRKSAPVSGL